MSSMLLAGLDRLPTVEGTRVRLRALESRDVPDLLAMFGDLEVVRWTSLPLLADERAAADLLAAIDRHFAERTLLQWGVARRDDDRAIGTFTIAEPDAMHGTATIGYAFGRAHWGQGYLRETLPLGVRFAFETLGLNRLGADADPRNAASMRALERAGFVREGYQRAAYRQYGEVMDAVLYGLLHDDWAAGLAAVKAPATAPALARVLEHG